MTRTRTAGSPTTARWRFRYPRTRQHEHPPPHRRGPAVIPAVIADSWFFWLAIIDGLIAVYILPTVIAIARQVEGLGLVICLNTIPVG